MYGLMQRSPAGGDVLHSGHRARPRACGVVASVVLVSALAGCASYSKPVSTQAFAPREMFSSFQQFELKPLQLLQHGHTDQQQQAERYLQAELSAQLGPLLTSWNQRNDKVQAKHHTLIVQPSVEYLKLGHKRHYYSFLNFTAAYFDSAYPSYSELHVRLVYKDAETGRIIASPMFYQRTDTIEDTEVLGPQNRRILNQLVTLITNYTRLNFDQQVGGPNGATVNMME